MQKLEHKFVGDLSPLGTQHHQQPQHHPHPHQQRREDLEVEEEERYTYSRPVSPLIAPSVKARPSSAAGDHSHNISGSSTDHIINSNNKLNKQSDRIEDDQEVDDRSGSPISFLDSPGPLIQAQDQGAASIDTTTTTTSPPTIASTTSQSTSTTHWTPGSTNSQSTATSSLAAAQAAASLKRDLRSPSPPIPSAASKSSPFDLQRGVLKPPSNVHSPAYKQQQQQQLQQQQQQIQQQQAALRSAKPPVSPTEKKKRNWLGFRSKDPSSSTAQQVPSKHQPPLQGNNLPIQAQSSYKGGQLPRQPLPPPPPPAATGRNVLQKKNKPGRSNEKSQQQVQQQPAQQSPPLQLYQNPHPINNSPEPSIASKYTNEEQDLLDDDRSEVTRNTSEGVPIKVRQPQYTPSESRAESPKRPSLEHLDPGSEPSIKTTASQPQQVDPSVTQKSPAPWTRPSRQGASHLQNTASTDETNTLRSAGNSAQNNRAELKYRDERFVSTSRPPSRQSIEPPSPSESGPNQVTHSRTSSNQNSTSNRDYMGGSSNQQQYPPGRNGDLQHNPGNREGQYGSTLSVNNLQSGSHRNTPLASPMVQDSSASGPGRNTPPPPPNATASKSKEDLGNLDMQQLSQKHDELNEKYRKVKKYYFDKDAQVQQLQNQLAHQRLAQSRTNLDDNEYATRFARLDGAINNLAFNIRKDWRAVPSWLAHCVNKDATGIVTKEMTAVGRACISRWLVDEVFDRYFHPALEPHLSCQLKVIEKNIRRFLPPPQTDEEREALVAKMSNWRLSTLDGLKSVLDSEESQAYRDELTKMLVVMLTEDLRDNLKEPPPPGLDAGVIGIIELAVGVAANIPYESRDIFVDYLMPGVPVNESIMKIEAALPLLTNPGEGLSSEHDRRPSMDSGDDRSDDIEFGKDGNSKKKGMLSGLISGGRGKGKDSQPKEDRVRFAAFMLVEVRGGKSVLVKAPVYV